MNGRHLRDEISARADGEDPGVSDAEIEQHLATCSSCREFAETTDALRRRLMMVEPPRVRDRSREMVESIGRDERRRSSTVIRSLLAGCALVMIAVSVPNFFSGEATEHSLRHIAAFRLAYGAGLLGVVARPARARTMFHVSVVLVIALVSTTVVDLFTGDLELLPESLHLVQVLTALLLWRLTRPDAGDATRDPVEPPAEIHDGDVLADDGSTSGRVLRLHDPTRPRTDHPEH